METSNKTAREIYQDVISNPARKRSGFGNKAVLDKYRVRGSISLSTALCEHHPEIIAMCAERDWEFFSHGIYNTRYTYGMSEQQEREMIRDSMATINKHTGQNCE